MSHLRRTVPALLVSVPLVMSAFCVPAQAAAPDPVAAGAAWLTTQFVDDSHLPTSGGDHFDSKFGSDYYPLYGANADVVFALAGAKAGAAKAGVALDYLDAHLDDYADLNGAFGGPYDGSVAKVALARIVAGADAHDLLTTLQADECAAGSTTCTPGSPTGIFASASASFVILAESRAGGSFAPSADAIDYFLSLQCANGGFTTGTSACGTGDADLDATSYAIMALQALGGHASEASDAADWLAGQQNPAGYWVSQGIPNTNTTGLATAALAGVGRDVAAARAWLTDQAIGAGKPGAGALKYGGEFTSTTTSATSPNVLATAQGILGLVDGGSLATVTAAGSSDDVDFLPPEATSTPSTITSGATVTLHGSGFPAGASVTASLCRPSGSCAYLLPSRGGTPHVAPDGTVSVTLIVPEPATASAGNYQLVLATMSPDLSASVAFAISASSTPPVPPTTAPTTSDPSAPTSSSPPLANTGADTSTHLPVGLLATAAGLVLLVVARERRRRGRHAA